MLEILQQDYAIRALLASMMVGITCGVLGCFIVLRNMSLIGDALSHAILPGVVIAFLLVGQQTMGFFLGAVIAGLLAAILITWIQRNVKTREDAVIGIVFTSMFALGVMGISWVTRQQGVHLDLKDFLFGNILGISDQDLWLTFLVMLFTVVCIISFYRYFFITTFGSVVSNTLGISNSAIHYFLMLLLSFAVVASLQSVGVILVVAMLITPASTAALLTQQLHKMLFIAAFVGIVSAVSGLLLAIVFQTTPGPAMTLVATFCYLLAMLFSPQKGLINKWLKKNRLKRKEDAEDILKQAIKLHEIGTLSYQNLKAKTAFTSVRFNALLKLLAGEKYLHLHNKNIHLTDEGIKKGYDLIRAHRLWEKYLVDVMGLNSDQIHDEAEKYEHLLNDKLLQEVEQRLGYPQLDPHGSPIPRRPDKNTLMLSQLQPTEKAIINVYQIPMVIQDLWRLELNPNHVFEVKMRNDQIILVEMEGNSIEIGMEIAQKVCVEKLFNQ